MKHRRLFTVLAAIFALAGLSGILARRDARLEAELWAAATDRIG